MKYLIYRWYVVIDSKELSYVGYSTMSTPKLAAGNRGAKYLHSGGSFGSVKSKMAKAIKTYGWSSFKSQVLDWASSKKDATALKAKYIHQFNSIEEGLNMLLSGGENPKEKKPVLQYDMNGKLIAEYDSLLYASKQTGLPLGSLSLCCRGKHYKSVGGYVWKFRNPEIKECIPDVLMKNSETAAKKKAVLQYDGNGLFIKEYKSLSAASDETGINRSNISSCCNGRKGYYLAGGYIWKYKNGSIIETQLSPEVLKKHLAYNRKSSPVLQYDKQGNFISEYQSIKDASIINGIKDSLISSCCLGRIKTAGEYIWAYKTGSTIEKHLSKKKLEKHLSVNYRRPPVLQYDKAGKLVGCYPSIAKAATQTKINPSNIGSCCSGKVKTAGGYYWKRQDGSKAEKTLSHKELEALKLTSHKKKAVLQYDTQGKLLKKYPSIAEASRQTGTSLCGIARCCKGTNKQAGGCLWQYQSETVNEKRLAQKPSDLLKSLRKRGKAVLQYDERGKLLDEYLSAKEASSLTGISYCCIVRCCNGQLKKNTAGGYGWKYKQCA